MDLRQLRYFIALNEHRSFVRAAEAMGITQPAFSRSIQGLEQEFGCVLVDRGNKDLRPTPEGQVVLQHAVRRQRGAVPGADDTATPQEQAVQEFARFGLDGLRRHALDAAQVQRVHGGQVFGLQQTPIQRRQGQ